jgi:hypothetical protein
MLALPASLHASTKQLLPLDTELRETFLASGQLLSARNLRLLERYYGLTGGTCKTLEELGVIEGITRERVRQIVKASCSRLRHAYIQTEPASVTTLRNILELNGDLIEMSDLEDTFRRFLPDSSYLWEPYLKLLLHAGAAPGIFTLSNDILAQQNARRSFGMALDSLKSALDASGEQLLEDLELAAAPFLHPSDDEMLTHQTRCLASIVGKQTVPALYSARPWKRADYARFVLDNEGAPLHYRDIAKRMEDLMDKSITAAGLNNLLNRSPLFVRVGAGDFGLAVWGTRRYGRFDEVIERFLASGRIAEHITTIKKAVLIQYTVAESTVTAMLSMTRDKFRYFGGGYWGLRSYAPLIDPTLVAHLQELILKSSRPMVAPMAEQYLSALLSHNYVAGEATRVLYVSHVFRRMGRHNPTFVLSEG